MKALLFLLVSAILATALAAPTPREMSMEEQLLATAEAAEKAKTSEERATAEQRTFKELRKLLFNSTLNYLRNRFLQPSMPLLAEEEEENEAAEIEQKTFRELVGHVLNGANDYAQNKLNPTRRRRPSTLRQLFGRVLDGVNNYAQNKLQPRDVELLASLQAVLEDENVEIEQSTLRELIANIVNGVNNYAQNKLNPDDEDQSPGNVRQLLARFLADTNKLVQRRLLQQPEIQQLLYRLPGTGMGAQATIEQESLGELGRKFLDVITTYLNNKLDESGGEDNEEAREQFIGSLLAAVGPSLLSSLAGGVINRALG